MPVLAELLLHQLKIDVATVVKALDLDKWHVLAIDDEPVRPHLDMVTRQAHHTLDEIDRWLGRPAKHHHITMLGQTKGGNLGVPNRQSQSKRKLVDDNEVAVQQRRHHGVRRDAIRLKQKRAQH